MKGLLLLSHAFPEGRQGASGLSGGELLLASPSRSGVFSKATDRRVERFTESISFDRRLLDHDIAGSIAHAQMLAAVGLISGQEASQICSALTLIRSDIESGKLPLRA